MAKVEQVQQVTEPKKVEASISGIIMVVTMISTILPYVMQILEALNAKKTGE